MKSAVLFILFIDHDPQDPNFVPLPKKLISRCVLKQTFLELCSSLIDDLKESR